MNISNRKTTATLIAIFLMISMGTSMILVPFVSAHGPGSAPPNTTPWQIPTFAHIFAAPNPVGVGQLTWIDMFLANPPFFSAAFTNNYRYHNYQLTITSPDGTNASQTFAYISDSTNNQNFAYTPTEVGTYNLTFYYPGETITALEQPVGSVYVNDSYLPSTATTSLTVTQEPIPSALGSAPLPTEYWTRPIYGSNTNWYTIASQWYGSGVTGFGASIGPNEQMFPGQDSGATAIGPITSHIMWTDPTQLGQGGVVGGTSVAIAGDTYFDGSAYEQRFVNPIILNGFIYYTEAVSFTGAAGGLQSVSNYGPTDCVNLRTGQLIWSSTQIPALSFGYIYDVQDPNQHGVYQGILFTSNFARAFDAATGDPLFNVTGVPSGSGIVLGPSGEAIKYIFANGGTTANPSWYLSEWNSSRLWETFANPWTAASTNVPTLYNDSYTNGTTLSANDASNAVATQPAIGTPAGTNNNAPATSNYVIYANVVNASSLLYSYDWNFSVPWHNTMTATPSILSTFYGNLMLCRNGSYPALGANNPYTYFAVNLNASRGTIGSILWMTTEQPPAGNITTITYAGADPAAGAFCESYRSSQQFVGYSLTTGQQIWGPTASQPSLDYFGSTGPGTLADQIAYGNIYSVAYSGVLYCYSLATGQVLWTYGNGGAGNSTNAGLNTAYGDYPTFINAVGNGIIYTVTTEHTIETPIWKGGLARAINASTGAEIWTLSDFTTEFGAESYAIADGYATFFNGYDNSIYSVGQGPSAMTIEAPMADITLGSGLVIRGTVTDISAGTKQDQQVADFPNGVPVASDASMSGWMSYVYQQQPMPTNATGVPVTLTVTDSNGNTRPIGTTTSDSSGAFSFQWTPDITGKFTVTATFAGSNAYYGSSAETAFAADPAATPTPTQAPQQSTVDQYFVPAVAGIIVAIAIVGAVLALLVLRKRP
jgi:hypothetical protein